MRRLPFTAAKELTWLFGDALIWAWSVDTRASAGAGFVRQEMTLFNEALLLLREERIRHGALVAKLVKMYRVIQWYRTETGRRSADDALDGFVRLLGDVAREVAFG